MPPFLQAVAKQRGKLWTASADAIAQWWRDRDAVQVVAQGERIKLDVARDGIKGVKLIVIGPVAGKAPRVDAGDSKVELRKLDEQRWALVLPELKAGKQELRVRF
jgi:hypothetical protein